MPLRQRPLLLGHRGARAVEAIPENTLPSFDLALQHGCDGFEFDVRLARDGFPVICHDAEVAGTKIAEAQREALRLPGLEEVLARYSARAFLDIELKVPGLDGRWLTALQATPPRRGWVASSFLPEALKSLRACASGVPLGIICDQKKELARWRHLPVEYVIPHHTLVSRQLIHEVHAAGKQLFAWTVNDERDMVRLAEWGVDGIISDETERLCRMLGPG